VRRLLAWVIPNHIAPSPDDTLGLLLEELAMWAEQFQQATEKVRTASAWETSNAFVYGRQLTDHADRWVQ
jgi:hypothetical protein